MPGIEPPPTPIEFPSPPTWPDADLVAVGGDLRPGTILGAYRRGLFPMRLDDGSLGWWSPLDRAVLPLANLKISRSLSRSCRRYTVSFDSDFEGVMVGCADLDRPNGWIDDSFILAYSELHRMGWAHSFEVWDAAGDLVGGLYGVSLGGLFCGESMFHRATDASKVALVHLVSVMSERDGRLLDVQWLTPHLESLGAAVIGRHGYLAKLPAALAAEDPFDHWDGP